MPEHTRAFAVDTAYTTLRLDSDSSGFSWDEATTVQVDNAPYQNAFDTDRFYKIPLTAAKPVEQEYTGADGDEITMVKPAEELRDAAWSMNNSPLTLGHPSSRIVDSVDLVHGFLRNATWNADDQALRADALIPTTDDAAREWVEKHDGVSIGFWYEADTEVDTDGVDALQRDLLVDHVAVVAEGRCSREDGCGLGADQAGSRRVDTPSCPEVHDCTQSLHCNAAARREAEHEGAVSGLQARVDSGCSPGPCSCGKHAADKTEARERRAEYRFETREAAANAAEELDCADAEAVEDYTHSHEKDNGATVYMPCAEHGEFREQFDDKFGDEYQYDGEYHDDGEMASPARHSAKREACKDDEDGNASTEGEAADIDINEQQIESIKTIREEHNEMDKSEYSPNLSTLKKVYKRGAGAYNTGHAPGATMQQWALARVKEFLKDLRNGNELNSGADNDLAPDGYSTDNSAKHSSPANANQFRLVVDAESVDELDLSPPDKVVNAVEAGMEAKEEYADDIGDCGTGVGEAMGKKIVNDELTPEILANGGDVASNSPSTYLQSHEDDVAADGPPTSWSEADWTENGCGEVQQALWGFYVDWFARKQEQVEEIRNETGEHASGRDSALQCEGCTQSSTSDAIGQSGRAATDRPTEDRHWTDYGKVSVSHQTGTDAVTVDMAAAPADFYVAIHDDGDQYVRQNISAGEQLGRAGPMAAYGDHGRMEVPLDEPIAEARTIYAVLYYADTTGDMDAPIESQQGFIFDSATLMPDDSTRRSIFDSNTGVADELMQRFTVKGDAESRTVAGVTFTGLMGGDLDESEIPNDDYETHYLYPGDTKSDSSYPVVDADGNLRRGNVDAAYQLGARGGVDADEHDQKLMRLNEVFVEAADYSAPIDTDTTMTDNKDGAALSVSDLTVDALADKHEGVSELRSEADELEAKLDAATDTIESLKEELAEYREDEKAALVDDITDLADTWEREDLLELDMDELEARHDLATDMAASVSGSGAGNEVETDDASEETGGSDYEVGEVFDLSDTA